MPAEAFEPNRGIEAFDCIRPMPICPTVIVKGYTATSSAALDRPCEMRVVLSSAADSVEFVASSNHPLA